MSTKCSRNAAYLLCRIVGIGLVADFKWHLAIIKHTMALSCNHPHTSQLMHPTVHRGLPRAHLLAYMLVSPSTIRVRACNISQRPRCRNSAAALNISLEVWLVGTHVLFKMHQCRRVELWKRMERTNRGILLLDEAEVEGVHVLRVLSPLRKSGVNLKRTVRDTRKKIAKRIAD